MSLSVTRLSKFIEIPMITNKLLVDFSDTCVRDKYYLLFPFFTRIDTRIYIEEQKLNNAITLIDQANNCHIFVE